MNMYNLIPKEKDSKDIKDNKNLIIAIAISLIVFLFLIYYINIQDFFFPKHIEKEIPFKNCEVLAESCLDKDCPYYFLCDVVEFDDCSVYDCETYYGVLIKNKQGETIVREQPKPDKEKVRETLNKCRGTVEVLEKKYKDGKLEIKTSVVTKGDCEILSFIVKTDKGYQTPLFEKKDDYYNLVFSASLKDVFEIIAVGEGGVSIREK